jgi:hypothetical protein
VDRLQAHAVDFASWEASMGKTKKTAAELEVMILSRMETISECPVGMTVIVKRRGDTWEALPMSPDQEMYLDCFARVTRYAAVLRTEYDLAE